ncbi:hypothetical protein Pcinc_041966 [Petrolisthes cinctipes]|uniref:Uncharacterized protein n=1 Tax=Petrolisthes cinctipes TaxID=88211 RepID=A0AAE1EGH8_PETCI|nr:hypothetical protein Pcinc_041966 [Petrolisthes cinctipes]
MVKITPRWQSTPPSTPLQTNTHSSSHPTHPLPPSTSYSPLNPFHPTPLYHIRPHLLSRHLSFPVSQVTSVSTQPSLHPYQSSPSPPSNLTQTNSSPQYWSGWQ